MEGTAPAISRFLWTVETGFRLLFQIGVCRAPKRPTYLPIPRPRSEAKKDENSGYLPIAGPSGAVKTGPTYLLHRGQPASGDRPPIWLGAGTLQLIRIPTEFQLFAQSLTGELATCSDCPRAKNEGAPFTQSNKQNHLATLSARLARA